MKLSNPIFDLPNIMSPYKLTIVGLTLLFLSGCVAIPVGESEPFPEEVTKTIVAGKTSRKSVLTTLGAPLSTNANETLFIYTEKQIKALVVLFAGGPAGGIIPIPIGPTHYYLISFTRRGTVSRTKIVTKISDYCTADGRCLYSINHLDTWLAPAATEASAKKFTPISDKCTIYFIGLAGLASGYPFTPSGIILDRRKIIQFPAIDNDPSYTSPLSDYRFFYWIVVPAGIHEISHSKKPMSAKVRHRPLSFQCHAGDMVFIAPFTKINRDLILTTFTLVEPKKAKSKILRWRMLDPGK